MTIDTERENLSEYLGLISKNDKYINYKLNLCENGEFKPRKDIMNIVTLTGRLTRDPEIRVGAQSQTSVAKFSIAINRGKNAKGEDLGADYPNIVAFGKTAELIEKYFAKGKQIGITGRLRTDSYEKDGHRIYYTEVVADRIDFLDKKETPEQNIQRETPEDDLPYGFAKLTDDDIPF